MKIPDPAYEFMKWLLGISIGALLIIGLMVRLLH